MNLTTFETGFAQHVDLPAPPDLSNSRLPDINDSPRRKFYHPETVGHFSGMRQPERKEASSKANEEGK